MKHYTTSRFWENYNSLPKEVRYLADRVFELLKQDSTHPSLHFKKIGSLWSARVGLGYRTLASELPDGYVWFWIGSHAEYDKLVN